MIQIADTLLLAVAAFAQSMPIMCLCDVRMRVARLFTLPPGVQGPALAAPKKPGALLNAEVRSASDGGQLRVSTRRSCVFFSRTLVNLAGALVGPWQAHGEDEDASLLKLADTPRARSAATLVVAAVTLLPQWEAELKRHAPSLKVGPPPSAMHTVIVVSGRHPGVP
jgi:hypothetical protein